MRKEPGGGYPSKVDTMMKKYAAGVQYIQYEGGDLSVLQKALESGRMPAVTYNGHDCHYSGGISHMVNIVGLNAEWAVVMDNNYIGETQLVWMKPAAFLQRFGGKQGWAVFLLHPGPPAKPYIKE
jgi:hypothetical protein